MPQLMDTARISIARLLQLDVPFDWQDAVAVVQEVAMLSDVHAAMYNRPSLVSPEHCYITRAGSVELPETTDAESPEAVPDLLRALLAGRDAPEALEDLAFGMATRDMTGELAAFPVGNRRAVIAKLAARALAAPLAPSVPGLTTPASVAPSPAVPSGAPEAGSWQPTPFSTIGAETPGRGSVDPPSPVPDAAALARETFRPVLVPPPARAPFVAAPAVAAAGERRRPPFVASPLPVEESSAPPAAVAGPTASQLELERIRNRSAARQRAAQRWTERIGTWLTWRPSFPDPRVLGSAAIVTAAIVSMVWHNSVERTTRPVLEPDAAVGPGLPGAGASGAALAVAATPPTDGGSPSVLANPATPSRPTPTIGPSVSPGARSTRGAARPTTASTASEAPPRIALPSASRPPELDPGSSSAPLAPPGGRAPTMVTPADTVETPTTAAATMAAGRPVAEAPRAAGPTSTREPDAPNGALFTSGDDGVVPPVIRRQHLPSNLMEPMTEVPDDWPFLELLIDARGDVEQVRLHARQLAPGQTLYRHRMLLAAAKAWRFEPARRHGEAVRYLMRVPLEP